MKNNNLRLASFIFILISMLFYSTASYAYKIKNCSADAETNLERAADFIEDNMSAIVDQYVFLSAKQRQEIVRKWVKIIFKCNDKARMCKRGSNTYGFSHGGIGNKLTMCHANMVGMGFSTCDAVEAIMHETGHAHGFRKVKGHNDPTAYHFSHDPIYRMGIMAEDFCLTQAAAGTVADTAFIGVPGAALGSMCSRNTDCRSSKCEKKQCVCNDNTDCAAGEACYKPATKLNYCRSTSLALGASCNKNSQCASSKCEKKECVCKANSDCAAGLTCFKPATKKNYCGTTGRANGVSCNKNKQCASNKCKKKECVSK